MSDSFAAYTLIKYNLRFSVEQTNPITMNKPNYPKGLILLLMAFFSLQSIAQTSTSWTGVTNAAWATSSNWTNGVPDSNKNAIIGDAFFTGSFQPKIFAIAVCNSLTIGGAINANLNISQSLRVCGNVNIRRNGTITHTTSSLSLKGNWSNSGSYVSFVNSRVNLIGSVQDVGGDSVTVFRKLIIASGSTMVMSNNLSVSGSSSFLQVYGTINPGVSPGYLLTSTISTRIENGGKLMVNKANFSDNYAIAIGTIALNSGSIVDYASTTVNQSISSAYTYSTLMISGTGTKSLVANLPALYSRTSTGGRIVVNSATLDMGSFTANRGTSVSGGDLLVSNGATIRLSGSNNFPSNFSNVSFGAASLTNYYGSNQIISSQTYGNLTLQGSGTKSTATGFSVAGDFTIQNGTLSTAANLLSISIKGAFIMNGGALSGTNSTYIMSGSSDQSMNLLSPLVNLTVNKTSGKLILTSDVNVTNNLTFTKGVIQTDNNDLIVDATTTITGAAETTGWVYGNLKRQLTTGTNLTKNFEIGSSAYYSPATVTFASVTTGGYLTGSVVDADHSELNYSGIDPQKSVNQYWSFTNSGVSYSTADLTLTWQSSAADPGLDFNTIQSAKFNGSAWSKYTISSETLNTIQLSGLTALDDFAAGNKVSNYYWTGDALSTDWFTPKNWFGGLPDSASDVTIPYPLQSRRIYPILTGTQNGQVRNFSVENNASIIVDEGLLQIFGNASNDYGVFDATNGTIEFRGSGSQTITNGLFTGNKLKNLIISNDVILANSDTLTGVLTVNEGKTFYTNNNLTLKSDANGTARIAELPTDGSGRATAFIDGRVSIERFIPARKAWRLLSSPVKSASAPTICAAWQENAYGSSLAGNFTSNSNPVDNYGAFIMGGSTSNGFDQSLTNLPSLKYYDNTVNSFVGIPQNPGTFRPITDYNGYMIYIRGDRSINPMLGTSTQVTPTTLRVKGEVITGNYPVAVNPQRFTVFGNPYASPINFGTLTKDNVKNSFYIWDPRLAGSNGLGAYVTVSYNSGSGTYDVTTSASSISQYIPSGEAILVESADGVRAGTITVKESDKTSNGTDNLFGRPSTAKIIRANLYEATADGNYGLLDASMTSYHDANDNSYNQDDVSKLNAAGESLSFFRNGHTLAIERRKTINGSDTSFINLSQMNKRNYRLDIVAENMGNDNTTAVVKDKFSANNNDIPVDLKGTTHVDFTVNDNPASFAADRFYIVFNVKPKSNMNPSSADESKKRIMNPATALKIYPNPVSGNQVNVELKNMNPGTYTMKLYNINGQLVATSPLKYVSGMTAAKINVPAGSAPGKYELKIVGESVEMATSLIKE